MEAHAQMGFLVYKLSGQVNKSALLLQFDCHPIVVEQTFLRRECATIRCPSDKIISIANAMKDMAKLFNPWKYNTAFDKVLATVEMQFDEPNCKVSLRINGKKLDVLVYEKVARAFVSRFKAKKVRLIRKPKIVSFWHGCNVVYLRDLADPFSGIHVRNIYKHVKGYEDPMSSILNMAGVSLDKVKMDSTAPRFPNR